MLDASIGTEAGTNGSIKSAEVSGAKLTPLRSELTNLTRLPKHQPTGVQSTSI